MKETHRKLNPRDAAEFRRLHARISAAECGPCDMTMDQAVAIFTESTNFLTRIAQQYEVDLEETWAIDPINVTIYYGAEG